MLDQLRRHAGSWVIKAVLSLIILSFIVFFGYSHLSSQYADERHTVAKVGNESIPRKKFEAHLETARNRLKEGLKGEVPDGMENFLRQNVLDQLIQRGVLLQYATHLGFTVSDEEVAQTIRSNKQLFPNGVLDLKNYEDSFLPSYRQRFGENFEEAIRQDLLIEKLQTFAWTLFSPWEEEIKSVSFQDVFNLWAHEFREQLKVDASQRL